MLVFRKGTLLIPTGPVKHLHIVMNDPVFSPEYGDMRVLIVNISSIKPDTPYDNACTLSAGIHPFIRQPSYVYYKEAVVSLVPRIEEKIGLGEYDIKQPVDEPLYDQVLAGFATSRHAPPKIKRFIKAHILTAIPPTNA